MLILSCAAVCMQVPAVPEAKAEAPTDAVKQPAVSPKADKTEQPVTGARPPTGGAAVLAQLK